MKVIFSLIILLMALSQPLAISAADSSDNKTEEVTMTKNPPIVTPPKGKRCPSMPVIFILDFNKGEVYSGDASTIDLYEVWDADQEILIASFTESADLLNFLSNSSDCYTLCFLSEDYVYTGYYGW